MRRCREAIGGCARRAGLAPLFVVIAAAAAASARAEPPPDWPQRLAVELAQLDDRHAARIGVYVRDLDRGTVAAHRADETWYVASMVKVLVAVEVLRAIERGEHTLDTPLTLRASDYVDGSGSTNLHAPGTRFTIAQLLEQMIVHSDNTASDMLIGLVGLRAVNALAASLPVPGWQPITTLADVRRHVYAELAPQAWRLSGQDFLLLDAERPDEARLQRLAQLLQVPREAFRLPSLHEAYDAYYAQQLNSARLDAYGELLARLADGRLLDPAGTAYLLGTMEHVRTGPQRLRAGLPAGIRLAHKTGTQRARICDAGIAFVPRAERDRRIVVVACTRDEPSLPRAEDALRDVATALCRSGVFHDHPRARSDEALRCPPAAAAAAARAVPVAAPAERAR